MDTKLLDIQPRELKFVFELKKQSSCSIQLINNSDQYVAFKVKTTSPKKYCVRPNAGIIKPKATCDFTVTMQAQRVAPPDMQCKDKFLIQSTLVPFGTTDENITSALFSEDSGKYVEEKKLRVVLVSPPSSPVLMPTNVELRQDSCIETLMQKDRVRNGIENIPPPNKVAKDEPVKAPKDIDELRANEEMADPKLVKSVMDIQSAKEAEELRLKLDVLETKLSEAELTITKLIAEKRDVVQEKEMLEELETSRRKNVTINRRVQIGFPFLYVVMVALIGLVVGYLMHP